MAVVAAEFHSITPSLFVWSVYDPQVKCDLNATALIIKDSLIVIDPVPLEVAAWKELIAHAPLRALLLTNGNHARYAEVLRRSYKVPVVTSASTKKDLVDLKPDVILLESELLYGVSALPIPGATPGETAFLAPNKVLILGDAVINLENEHGLQLLPDKYASNPKENRASLRKLLALDFNIITFAHGAPLVQGAKDKLAALLDR